jgi:hypothetical protein
MTAAQSVRYQRALISGRLSRFFCCCIFIMCDKKRYPFRGFYAPQAFEKSLDKAFGWRSG